jgi:nucleotide-binding universal stress UspA family protein
VGLVLTDRLAQPVRWQEGATNEPEETAMVVTIEGAVVVGVDVLRGSDPAIQVAAQEAARAGRRLLLLNALSTPSVGFPFDEWLTEARLILESSADALRQAHADLTVETKIVSGPPGPALVRVSKVAALLVVGTRGGGGFSGLLFGSVARHVVTRAVCPVVVVPVRATTPATAIGAGPVMVGVDGSADSAAAVDFAFAEASGWGRPLVLANVWASARLSGLSKERTWSEDASQWQKQLEADADRLVSEAAAGHSDRYPGVTVERLTVHGLNIARTLLDAADRADAALLVVGGRGHGGPAQLLVGSVTEQVAHHADRPVAIVRSTGATEQSA